jgi:hypothetical protein
MEGWKEGEGYMLYKERETKRWRRMREEKEGELEERGGRAW